MASHKKDKKLCFVTFGATAAFPELLEATLAPAFLSALRAHGYTDLLISYGSDGEPQYEMLLGAANAKLADIQLAISGFGLDPAGLTQYMFMARSTGKESEGVVICHAGSGTILDALRVGAQLIVVPNTTLLDNHQVELAETLAEQGYVVHGRLDDLPAALTQSEKLRQRHKAWPPVNSGKHRQQNGLKGVIDDEMGFLD